MITYTAFTDDSGDLHVIGASDLQTARAIAWDYLEQSGLSYDERIEALEVFPKRWYASWVEGNELHLLKQPSAKEGFPVWSWES